MARTISDEEIQLRKRARRRLVGAVALVLLAVVFLPMVLDKEPKPVSQDIAIRIPDRAADDFAPAPDKAVAAPAPQAQPPLPAQPAPAAKPAEQPAVPAAPKESPKAAAPAAPRKAEPQPPAAKPAPKAEAPRKKEVFVVQLGAFSNPANAKQLLAKLTRHKIKGYSEILKTSSGNKTRVRAGPYATREEAEREMAHLRKLGIVKGGAVVPETIEDHGRKAGR